MFYIINHNNPTMKSQKRSNFFSKSVFKMTLLKRRSAEDLRLRDEYATISEYCSGIMCMNYCQDLSIGQIKDHISD